MSAASDTPVAILFTDAVGFSEFVHHDEAEALMRLRAHRERMVPAFEAQGGRVVKSTGDGLLVEFPDPVAAVRGAVEAQQELARYEDGAERPLRHRMGIHAGPVVREGNDVLGDTVNLAARIEPMAEPGGVCVTDVVMDVVGVGVGTPYTVLGRTRLKNIPGLHRVHLLQPVYSERRGPLQARARFFSRQRPVRNAAAALAALGLAGVSLWVGIRSGAEEHRVIVAVSDVVNATGDASFDGLSLMLITTLEEMGQLMVIPRARLQDALGPDSPEHLDPAAAARAARKVGAEILVVPTIARDDQALRITTEIEDLGSDERVRLPEITGEEARTLVDDLGRAVGVELEVHLRQEQARLTARETFSANMEAYSAYFLGEQELQRGNFGFATDHFERSVRLDPGFALAWLRLAYSRDWRGLAESRRALERAQALGLPTAKGRRLAEVLERKVAGDREGALELLAGLVEDYPGDKEVRLFFGDLAYHANRLPESIVALEQVLTMDSGSERAHQHLVWALRGAGRTEDAIEAAKRWVEITESPNAWAEQGATFVYAGRFDEAIEVYRTARAANRSWSVLTLGLVGAYFFAERFEEAERLLADALEDTDAARRLYPLRARVWYYSLRGKSSAAAAAMTMAYDEHGRYDEEHSRRMVTANALLAAYHAPGSRDTSRWIAAARQIPDDGDRFSGSWLALAELRDGRLEEAAARAESISGLPELAKLLAAERHIAAGDTPAGARILEAVGAGPSRWYALLALDRLGRLHEAEGDPASTARAYEALVAIRVFNEYGAAVWSQAWYALGRAREATGDPRGARDAYETFMRLWAQSERAELADARARAAALAP